MFTSASMCQCLLSKIYIESYFQFSGAYSITRSAFALWAHIHYTYYIIWLIHLIKNGIFHIVSQYGLDTKMKTFMIKWQKKREKINFTCHKKGRVLEPTFDNFPQLAVVLRKLSSKNAKRIKYTFILWVCLF